MLWLVILSGELCSGKTTLAVGIAANLDAEVVAARDIIRRGRQLSRSELQDEGQKLEADTGGTWVADGIRSLVGDRARSIVFDSARTPGQLEALRGFAGFDVLRVHLAASEAVRRTRFDGRADPADQGADFDAVDAREPAEHEGVMGARTDLNLDTSSLTPAEVLRRSLDVLAAD